MSEIDKFCMFVNTTNGLCRSPINTNNKYCDEIPIERCYYKQLRQLKESNKTLNEMLLILNNRLDEYKRIYGEL